MRIKDFKERNLIDKFLITSLSYLILIRFLLAGYYPVFSDAFYYLYIAKHPELLLNPLFNYYPPLLMLIGTGLYPVFGEFGLKIITPFFGAISLIYTYKIGKELFDERGGLIAAFLLGIIPSHIYLSAMAYTAAIVTAMLTVFVYYLIKSISEEERRNEIKAGIFAAFTALSKLTGAIVFPIMILYPLAILIKDKILDKKILKKVAIIFFIAAILSSPYYIRSLILFGTFLEIHVIDKDVDDIAMTYKFDKSLLYKDFSQRIAFHKEGANIIDYAREVYLDFWGIPVGISVPGVPDVAVKIYFLITVFASLFIAYGIANSIKSDKNDRKMLLIYIWLLAWIIALVVFREKLIWGYRRLLPVTPALILLSARGLYQIERKNVLILVFICFLIVFPTVQLAKGYYANNYFNEYSDAFEYLRNLPEAKVILAHDVEQCIYYTEKKCYLMGELNPAYLNITTLRDYNITHIIRYENYLFFDLSEHIKKIDEMAENGELKPVWESKTVKIFEVVGMPETCIK